MWESACCVSFVLLAAEVPVDTEFCLACLRGDEIAVQEFLEKDQSARVRLGNAQRQIATPDRRMYIQSADWSPLYCVLEGARRDGRVTAQRIRIVKSLLRHGVDTESRDWSGRTALCVAVSLGDVELVTMLLQANADPNQGTTRTIDSDVALTPLHIAINSENARELIPLLMDEGANPMSKTAKGLTPAALARLRFRPDLASLIGDIAAGRNVGDRD